MLYIQSQWGVGGGERSADASKIIFEGEKGKQL